MSIVSVMLLSIILTVDTLNWESVESSSFGDSTLISYDEYVEYYDLLVTADLISGYHDYMFEALGEDYRKFDHCYNPILKNLCKCAEEFLPQWEADKFCN